MEFLIELWKPILLGGIGVFIVSALVWTVMPHHKTEFQKLPSEDAIAAALRAAKVPAGLYSTPHFADQAAMNTPEGKSRMEAGPLAYITVAPPGVPSMGPMMAKSAIWNIVVAAFIAYVCWHTLPVGTEYLQVFRVAGTLCFMTCWLGAGAESIWFARPWKSWGLQAIDALMYSFVIGGVFGWLWP